jgi:2-hydroxychromene-2-carboxylate isomerase
MAFEFWFEFASTYSYPAALRLPAIAERAGIPVLYRPFLLGPIFASQGWDTSPFNIYEAKGRYMWRDLQRICERQGLPLRRPSVFPRNGLHAARIALLAENEPWGPRFVRAVYTANFAEDRDIAEPGVLSEILRDLGQDPEALSARAADPDTKARLRARTEDAARSGIFGSPSFVVSGELFWGNDRLECALEWASPEARGIRGASRVT